MAKCTVSVNEGGPLGKHTFVGTPRVGEEVLIPVKNGKSHTKFVVSRVVRRAKSADHSGKTFVFVSKAQ